MIQEGFDYGDGYEKATEPGPDVEVHLGGWGKRNDKSFPLISNFKYRKPIKPKDETMEDKYVTARASGASGSYDVRLNLDEAERVGEEAKRIKAEIAKREEIGHTGLKPSEIP